MSDEVKITVQATRCPACDVDLEITTKRHGVPGPVGQVVTIIGRCPSCRQVVDARGEESRAVEAFNANLAAAKPRMEQARADKGKRAAEAQARAEAAFKGQAPAVGGTGEAK